MSLNTDYYFGISKMGNHINENLILWKNKWGFTGIIFLPSYPNPNYQGI
jgi:hypothetical protein